MVVGDKLLYGREFRVACWQEQDLDFLSIE
jgi:hypothetical protein